MTREGFGSLSKDMQTEGPLDAALLLTPSGTLLAGWTREGLRQDIMSIMSATMTASIETLMEELRRHRPERILVEAGAQRFLVSRTENGRLLVLLAPSTVSRTRLVASAHALQVRLAASAADEGAKRHSVTPSP
jgi:predicted regulator of Ras-like GTPase activity (Roadblock/LC7/MglB family)